MNDLEKLVAQTLLFGFDGASFENANEQVVPLMERQCAGFILFSQHFLQRNRQKNIVDVHQTQSLLHQLNRTNEQYGNLPLLLAIDYEGGQVDRLAHLEQSPATLSAKQSTLLSESDFRRQAEAMARFCYKLGFNLNFAPVVDLDISQERGIINAIQRSFSSDPVTVIQFASQFMRPFLDRGIACCLKHFPGHGSACGDTHHEFVDVTETFVEQELRPYQDLLSQQHPLVLAMTAHVINRKLDAAGMPATLSGKILQGILREKYHYEGVIVSDDLQMHAIAGAYSLESRLIRAIHAGCDLLIFGNQLQYNNPIEIIDTMVRLVENGDICVNRLNEAASRVSRLRSNIKTNRSEEAV